MIQGRRRVGAILNPVTSAMRAGTRWWSKDRLNRVGHDRRSVDYAKSGDPEIGVVIKRHEWVEGTDIGYRILDIRVGMGSNMQLFPILLKLRTPTWWGLHNSNPDIHQLQCLEPQALDLAWTWWLFMSKDRKSICSLDIEHSTISCMYIGSKKQSQCFLILIL